MVSKNTLIIRFGDVLKTTRPGHHLSELVYPSYSDKRLCVVHTITSYLARTQPIRHGAVQLLLSYKAPFRPVSRDTISRWVKTLMCQSGIDLKIFKPHSTRAAAASATVGKVSLSTILTTVGWTRASTFRKFYQKPVLDKTSFAQAVMSTVSVAK